MQARGCNPNGCSPWSVSGFTNVAVTPARPSSLTAAANAGGVTVSWPAVNALQYYRVEKDDLNDAQGYTALSESAQVPPTESSITRELSGGSYRFRIAACANAGGFEACSAWRQSATATVAGEGALTLAGAPSIFNYDLSHAGMAQLFTVSDFVAITQGNHSVNSGASSYSIAIKTPPAINDLAPKISLSYSSQNTASGLLGVGWGISGLSSISRCQATFATEQEQAQKPNPRYSNGDRLCLNGQKLVLKDGQNNATDSQYWSTSAVYVTELDTQTRVRRNPNGNGFIAESKGGLRFYYGSNDGQEAIKYRAGHYGSDIASWALAKVEDRYSNFYTFNYQYITATNEHNIAWVQMSPNAQIVFNYEDRESDFLGGYDKGERYAVTQRLSNISTYMNTTSTVGSGTAVSRYLLDYTHSPITDRLLIDKVTECGFDVFGNMECARPLTFEWTDAEGGFDNRFTVMRECSGLTNDTKNCLVAPKTFDPLQAGKPFHFPVLTANGVGELLKGPVGPNTKKISIAFLHPGTDVGQSIHSIHSDKGWIYGGPKMIVGDLNNDGLTDFHFNHQAWLQKNTNGTTVFEPQAVDSNFDTYADGVFPYDRNTDGLSDIYLSKNLGNGNFIGDMGDAYFGFCYGRKNPDGTTSSISVNGQRITPCEAINGDFNGDGLLDSQYGINDGDFNSIKRNLLKPELPGMQVVDINRDGLDDVIYRTVENGIGVMRAQLATINTDGSVKFVDYDGDPLHGIIPTPAPSKITSGIHAGHYRWSEDDYRKGVTQKDVNGDGYIDYIRGDFSQLGAGIKYYTKAEFSNYIVMLAKRGQPDLLRSVTDGFGATVAFEYSELVGDANGSAPVYTPSDMPSQYPYKAPNPSMQVVKKFSISDGLGGFNDTLFNYYGGQVDVVGRGFTGFEKIITTDQGVGTKTTSEYQLAWPHAGSLVKQVVADLNGNIISTLQNDYEIHNQNIRLPIKVNELQEVYNLQSTPISATQTSYSYDEFGNLTRKKTVRSPHLINGTANNNWTNINVVSSRYDNNETNWLIGFQNLQEMTSEDRGFNTVTQSNHFTQESGTLANKTIKRFSGTAVESITTYTRNSQGIVTETLTSAVDNTQNPSAERSSTIVELEDTMFPTLVRNAKGHQTRMGYEKRFGKVNFVRDANGLESFTTFDSLGRTIESVGAAPGGQELSGVRTQIKNYYCETAPISCPEHAVYLTTTITQHPDEGVKLGAPLAISYYDSLQRVISTETFALDGTSVKQDTLFDAAGRVQQVSEPYTLFAIDFTTYSNYNALGEALAIKAADGGGVTIEHWQEGNLYVTEKTVSIAGSNSNNSTQITRTYTNELGQVVRVEDADNTPITYAYDPAGNLKETMVNDNVASKVIINHDAAGNKLWIQDPAAGRIDYVYNGFGELREQIWQKETSNQKSMRLDYDVLGRKIKRVDTSVTGSQKTYEWMYDVLNKGTLFAELNNSYHKVYFYDGYMRLSTTREDYGEGYIDTNYSYDKFNRPETTTYPGGLKVQQIYHAAGVPVQTLDITGGQAKLLWAIGDTVDERGNYTYQLMGNGVVTEQSFDALNGALRSITSGRITNGSLGSLNGTLQKLSYQWDSIGNLQQRRSRRVNGSGARIEDLTQNFMYDSLNRLDHAQVFGMGAIPSTRDYQYDAYGNLTHSGQSVQEYRKINGASIYGVTRANNINYHYDAYGNVVQRGNTLNEYDVFNKPTKLGNTVFWYGANHEKIKQKNGNKTTYFYMGGQYEVEDNNGTKTTTSYAGSYMQKKVGSTITHRYRLFDHLGSTDTILNESGGVEERMAFDPFGNTLETHFGSGALANAGTSSYKGYTGHDMLDDLGLIHMGGRVYDPAVGRFLSADLFVHSAYDTQSYNRYSYVRNNPLGATDPSGYSELTKDSSPPEQDDVVVEGRKSPPPSPGPGIGAMSSINKLNLTMGAIPSISYTPTLDDYDKQSKQDKAEYYARWAAKGFGGAARAYNDLVDSFNDSAFGAGLGLGGDAQEGRPSAMEAMALGGFNTALLAKQVYPGDTAKQAEFSSDLAFAYAEGGAAVFSLVGSLAVLTGNAFRGAGMTANIGKVRFDAFYQNGRSGGGSIFSVKGAFTRFRIDYGKLHSSGEMGWHLTFRFKAFGRTFGSTAQRSMLPPFRIIPKG